MAMNAHLAAELKKHGPNGAAPPMSLPAARAYCRRLAHTHYENFTVASWLLPRRLRPHFYSVYAYCRWADDLADETGDAARSLELLEWWRGELEDCYEGHSRHPVFVALRETIDEFAIPPAPFRDLLHAFRQDQTKTRYSIADELLDYCRYSANPVGRLVLLLGRFDSEANRQMSDSICTGLQLANFCQDAARDYQRGRIYLPQDALLRHGCDEETFALARADEPFCRMLTEQVDIAEQFLLAGSALPKEAPRDLRVDIELFLQGGLAILAAIRRCQYDVLTVRPVVGRWRKLQLLWRAWRGGGEVKDRQAYPASALSGERP